MSTPFRAYEACIYLINSTGFDPNAKTTLKHVARITQSPPHWGCLREALEIVIETAPGQISALDLVIEGLEMYVSKGEPRRLGTEYPIFFALRMIRAATLPIELRKKASILYMDMFSLVRLDPNNLDPNIYYIDAYSSRDALLEILSDPGMGKVEHQDQFRKSLLHHSMALINQHKHEATKRSKLDRFYEILSDSRSPGERQKSKAKHVRTKSREKSAYEVVPGNIDVTGQAITYSYPSESSDVPKTVCRNTPKHGSQLSLGDDRRALRSRINNQAARNVISLCDMHRLPLPLIVRFLSSLDDHPIAIVLGWLALTTGMAPDRLLGMSLGAKGDPRFDPTTAIMSYAVRNRPDEHNRPRMHLQLNPLAGKSIVTCSASLSQTGKLFARLSRDFSLHYPGQTPTLERIAASSFLHFFRGAMSELEAAHLSGDIPAKLRAQAHYYPIDVSKLNRKYQQQHSTLSNQILNMRSCFGRFRSFLEKLEPFPHQLPFGTIGSVHAPPVESIHRVLRAIEDKARVIRNRLKCSLRHERPQLLTDFIQLQHIQLYILEQLCLGMRKIGRKTSYSLAPSVSRGWGSEKASAAFSIERKTVPLINALEAQVKACIADWETFTRKAKEAGFLVKGTFTFVNPLPLVVVLDERKGLIQASKMTSSSFSKLLNDYHLPLLPKTGSERVHQFKHFVARELDGKLAQVLLDELLSHDRDGLDLCGPWSTASASSLAVLDQSIDAMMSRLGFQVLRLEDVQ